MYHNYFKLSIFKIFNFQKNINNNRIGKNMEYIKDKGYLVGSFSHDQIKNNDHIKALTELKQKTGLKFSNTEFTKTKGKIVSMEIYLCKFEDLKI